MYHGELVGAGAEVGEHLHLPDVAGMRDRLSISFYILALGCWMPEDANKCQHGSSMASPDTFLAQFLGRKALAFMALSMLSSEMTFMMSNFYLVNHHDEDIRRISWEVLFEIS